MARKRPIRTMYENRNGIITRIGRASSLPGAIKGATMKVVSRRYFGAQIMVNGQVLVNVTMTEHGIEITRQKPRKGR